MDVVDGLFSYAEDVQVERSFIRQSNDSKSLKNHIHAYNKNICVNSRASHIMLVTHLWLG